MLEKLQFSALLWTAVAMAASDPAQTISITDGPRIEYVDGNSAKIAWTSNVEGSATVRYGTERNNLSMVAQEAWGGKKVDSTGAIHRVELKNLQPNTTYYFTVESGEARGGRGAVAKSDIQTLQTTRGEKAKQEWQAAERGDIKAGPIAMNVTDSQATLWWSMSDEKLDGNSASVKFGKDKNNQSDTLQSTGGDNEHRATLSNLEPATTYFFTITSGDGQPVSTGEFKTENADFAHAKFRMTSGPVIEVIGRNSAVISWSTTGRSSSTVHYGTDPKNLSQAAQAPWGQQIHRVRITGLKPNTRYYFTVESAQAEGTGLSAKSNTAQFMTVSEGQHAMNFSKWF